MQSFAVDWGHPPKSNRRILHAYLWPDTQRPDSRYFLRYTGVLLHVDYVIFVDAAAPTLNFGLR